MSRLGPWLCAWLGLAGQIFDAGPAQAHPQFALSTVNRYGKLVLLGPRQARIFFTLMVGDVPALALRQQADKNGDGTLDVGEQQALAAGLREQVAAGVHVYRGESELPLSWELVPFALESPAVSATAFACELSTAVPTASDADELRYDDRVELPPMGEIELRVEPGPAMRVTHASSAVATPAPPAPGTPASSALVFQWYGPPRSSLSDRSVRVAFATSAPRPAARQRPFYAALAPWQLAVVGTAAVTVLAAILLSRRRRTSDRRS